MKIKIKVENVQLVSARIKKLEGYKPLVRSRVTKSLADMRNRSNNGLTPKKSGELRGSAFGNIVGDTEGEFGFSKEYAPYVEYGHRIVIHGRNVGWCRAKPYLKPNAEAQQPIFESDCEKVMDRLTRGI